MGKKIHFIGIGGIGMSGLAQLFLEKDFEVSGCDIKDSERLSFLKNKGAKIYLGHDPTHLKEQEIVVYSSAIKEDNSELQEAKKRNIRIMRRAEALAEIIKEEKLITVSGAHGKTTTSSLVAHILKEVGFSPSVVVGGIWLNLNNSACLGKDKLFVIEADESDGSFLYFKPDYSIITNIDFEHMDYYKDMEKLLATFLDFINNIHQDGCLIACAENKNICSILNKVNRKKILYGLDSNLDIYAKNIELIDLSSSFDCIFKGDYLGRFFLPLGGIHNVLNSLAVIALAKELGIENEDIKKALSTFKGTRRRIETKAFINGILFLDDYAHHPTEIRATLEAIRNLRHKRIVVVFQPHRFTRTKLLLDEFAKSFDLADEVVITDIYPADEKPIEAVTAKDICERINLYDKNKSVKFLPFKEIVSYLLDILKKDDLLITLGAGDIYKIHDELIPRIKG